MRLQFLNHIKLLRVIVVIVKEIDERFIDELLDIGFVQGDLRFQVALR